jgi:hypothetical protein
LGQNEKKRGKIKKTGKFRAKAQNYGEKGMGNTDETVSGTFGAGHSLTTDDADACAKR